MAQHCNPCKTGKSINADLTVAAVESNKWSAGEITIIGCADNINSTASHFGALCLVTIFMTLSKNIFSHGGNRSVCCGRFEDLGTGCQGEAGSEHARSGDGLVVGPHSRFWQVVVYCLCILMVLVIFQIRLPGVFPPFWG